jgi:nucleoside-diphosphate-sugar epimerase
MNVLLTGASGYIGGAVARALLDGGHHVAALARHPERLPAGVAAVPGDLADPSSLRTAAEGVDGVIDAAQPEGDAAGAIERRAVQAFLDALAGSGRFFVYTSGTWNLGATGALPADEDAPQRPPKAVAWRPAVERLVRDAARRDVRSVIIRPGLVHGHGGGYLPRVLAVRDGAVRPFGDAEYRWSVVHADDLGELYRLAAESAPSGSVYHGVGEVVHVAEIAHALAERQDARVEPLAMDEAIADWGDYAEAFATDQVVAAERARRELGWQPNGPTLLEDLLGVLVS